MKITCCMLVKNNENTLSSAIQSVRPHVDEIIVLDTGSTDSSVRMAYELGAQVYYYIWNENFSDARNVSLQHVKESDWVLVIDSDEEFFWEGNISFREWVTTLQSRQTIIAYECRHYETNDSRLLSITHAERLFSPEFYRYKGSIHESLVPIKKENKKLTKLCSFGSFRHIGYSSEFHEEKNVRNLSLLHKELELNPLNGLNYRYLAAELYNSGEYMESIEYAKTALELLPSTETYSRAQAHYYHIMAFLNIGKKVEADLAIKASIDELPFYTDPYGIAAEIYFSEQRWKEAFHWYNEWENKVEMQARFMPNHCISLADTFRKHKWISACHSKEIKELLRKEVHGMKVALLIINPQLEMDHAELFEHISNKFEGITYEIGVWSKRPFNNNSNGVKEWVKQNCVRLVEGKELADARSNFAAISNADILWIWNANERLVSELNEDVLLESITQKGEILVRSYSDRLGCQWTEPRIQLSSSAGMKLNSSFKKAAAASEVKFNQQTLLYNALIVERPFIIPPNKQSEYIEVSDEETPLQQLLIAFSSQRYNDVLSIRQTPIGSDEWATFQFYKILAAINLGMMEEASNQIYYALEADLREQEMLDFIYLYGKLSVNVEIELMKREAIELLEDTLQTNPILETKHVLTTESDWLSLIAELQWQLGERKRALVSWRHGLESCGYTNEGCAYRLAEAIYEEYKSEGLDKVSRKILENFHVQSPAAQSLLYPVFCYLNMQEWAVLFLGSRELIKSNELESPIVSIILPVYNDTQYLSESIRSILSQTYLDLELIVVDDGSENDVAAIVQRFMYDNRLRYYKLETNRGLPHALNYGLSMANGSLMGWTSADNFAHPHWLERMVQTISAYPKASAIYSDYYHIDKNGLVIETKRMPSYKLNGLQNGGPSLLWRASSFRKSGGFDESLFGIEDRDFTVRLALVGRIIQLQEPLYYYRIHENSLSSKIDSGFVGGWPELHEKLKQKWLCFSFV